MNTSTKNRVFEDNMSQKSDKAESRSTLKRDVSLALMVSMAGFAQPAFAYLDPSTGGMIISAILGLFATIGLALKTYWYKVKNIFAGSKTDTSDAEADSDKPES